MTKYTQRIRVLMLTMMIYFSVSAHDFEANGIYYNILSLTDKTVEVTFCGEDGSHNNSYSSELTIPSTVAHGENIYSVIQIGRLAFFEDNITKVTLPNSITTISSAAFSYSSLSNINITNSVTTIGGGAFEMCHNLTEIYIPKSVISMGSSPFDGCHKLMTISVSSENENYCSIDGVLYNKEVTKLINFPGGQKTCKIPNSVITICDYAFAWSNLEEVTIPNSVTHIGSNAFYLCNLTSITIPNSVTYIGSDAFCGNVFTEVFIPKSVEHIGSSSFDNVQKIAYPSTLSNPTPNCAISICYPIDALIDDSNGAIYSADRTILYYVPSNLESILLLEDTTVIGQGSFAYNKKVTNITLPNTVTTIGDYAFQNCSNLENVTLSNSATTIGNYAFQNCSKIGSVNIPNSVATIGEYAFQNCSNLKDVTLPNNLYAIIEYCAFQNCVNLTELTIPENLWKIKSLAFDGCTSLHTLNYDAINCTYCGSLNPAFPSNITTLNFGNSVYKIPAYAFYNCSNLTEVIIPPVEAIGDYAFENCTGIIKAAYPSGCKDPFEYGIAISYPKHSIIDSNNVIYNADMTGIYYVPIDTETIQIPDGLSTIGYRAFARCFKLQEVSIPNTVTSIGESAFQWCSSLKEITIPNLVPRISYFTFAGCTNLKSITIGSDVGYIASNAFWETNIVKAFWQNETPLSDGIGAKFNFVPNDSYNLPNQNILKYISNKFALDGVHYVPLSSTNNICLIVDYIGAQGNTNFTINGTVTNNEQDFDIVGINNAALYGLSALETITIPKNIRTIGKNAFNGCSGLKHFYSHAEEPPTCEAQCFDVANKWDCTLHIPMQCIDKYKAADQWKDFYFVEEFMAESSIEQIETYNTDSFEVYNLHGIKIGDNIDKLAPGLYIIRNENKTWEIRI